MDVRLHIPKNGEQSQNSWKASMYQTCSPACLYYKDFYTHFHLSHTRDADFILAVFQSKSPGPYLGSETTFALWQDPYSFVFEKKKYKFKHPNNEIVWFFYLLFITNHITLYLLVFQTAKPLLQE